MLPRGRPRNRVVGGGQTIVLHLLSALTSTHLSLVAALVLVVHEAAKLGKPVLCYYTQWDGSATWFGQQALGTITFFSIMSPHSGAWSALSIRSNSARAHASFRPLPDQPVSPTSNLCAGSAAEHHQPRPVPVPLLRAVPDPRTRSAKGMSLSPQVCLGVGFFIAFLEFRGGHSHATTK